MCEVPSNVLLADSFLHVFDGYSTGSNDLTQVALGAPWAPRRVLLALGAALVPLGALFLERSLRVEMPAARRRAGRAAPEPWGRPGRCGSRWIPMCMFRCSTALVLLRPAQPPLAHETKVPAAQTEKLWGGKRPGRRSGLMNM